MRVWDLPISLPLGMEGEGSLEGPVRRSVRGRRARIVANAGGGFEGMDGDGNGDGNGDVGVRVKEKKKKKEKEKMGEGRDGRVRSTSCQPIMLTMFTLLTIMLLPDNCCE